MSQEGYSFSKEIRKTLTLDYLLYLPEGYEAEKNQKWPLILFLHGSGERGSDIEIVKCQGLPKALEEGLKLPCIIVSPQCPNPLTWEFEHEAVKELLDAVIEKYNVDADRVYLTGLSMGGYGTWFLSMMYPEKFAAIVPICGGGDPGNVYRMKHIPAWVFHGELDDIVPIQAAKEMVEALKQAGGNVKFTVYPHANHNSWTETYDNIDVYNWILEQKRSDKR